MIEDTLKVSALFIHLALLPDYSVNLMYEFSFLKNRQHVCLFYFFLSGQMNDGIVMSMLVYGGFYQLRCILLGSDIVLRLYNIVRKTTGGAFEFAKVSKLALLLH